MAHPDLPTQPLGRTAELLAPGVIYLVLLGVIVGGAGFAVSDHMLMLILLSVGGSLLVLAGAIRAISALRARSRQKLLDQIARFVAHDASPSFTADADGAIHFQNHVALERFGSRGGQTMTRALGELFANPGSVVKRLQSRAETLGSARDDLVTRRGHVRLSVHAIGQDRYLWRLEDMVERPSGGRGADAISLPMLTASKNGTVLFMNEALRRLIGERVPTLDRIFTELPLRSGEEREIATPVGPVRALVVELEGSAGRSEIYLLPATDTPERPKESASFETLPVALLRMTGDGRVIAINRAGRAILGKVEPETMLSDLLEGLGRPVNDWVADALAGRAERRPEVLRVRRGDSEVFLQVTLSRVVDGGRTHLIGVLSDATQLKTLEAQFVQSQKMQAIGQLAGGVAHDFNNLLTAISGHCDLLMLRHDKGDPDYADLDQISQNTNRAASLVGQLLAFSRKQTLKPQTIDLRDTLSDLTHLLNRLVGEKVTLSFSHDPALKPVRADKRQLEQVIMNLVVNARDAMPGGGAIEVSTFNEFLEEDYARDRVSVPKGAYVVVRVSDEGTGIAADKIGKIFEPFFTTKRVGEGTGLGLSTAYGIVKQTGGYIFCDSVVGSGTSFSIYLPSYAHLAGASDPVEIAQISEDTPAEPRQATVLLVEDEAPVRAFAARALQLRGYTVLEADCGEEALEMIEDPAVHVDIFVTDVIMPGMDGPTWVAKALEQRPGTAVVFVSGYAEDVFSEGRAPVQNAVFLPKPFSLSELTATVQNQLS
ncbi:ATP-binding protein [Thioclava sp. A2]|nr:ATP-binding protein [Thioclava sp. A2]MDV7269798.1 ATP-binding protein [Thioclava sp. A2]